MPLRQLSSEPTIELFADCAMTATSDVASINACHSFIFEQPSEKRDASKRIPRPPNAFMLYRSNFLKSGAVPPEVEKRQQNLSRIAGQCWNMLPQTEKAIWFSKAAVLRAEHRAAKYPFHHAWPFYRDTNILLTKDKKSRNVTKSGCSLDRSRKRRTRTRMPYCEGVFALSSPETQTSPISPPLASETPLSLSTTASLSPPSLSQLLPPFTSYIYSSQQDSPVTSNPVIWRGKFGYPLDSSGSEATQWGLSHMIQDLEMMLSEVDSLQQPYPTFKQHGDDFTLGLGVPYPGSKGPLNNPVAQIPATLSGSNISPPTIDQCFVDLNDYNVLDDFACFN